MELEPVDKDMIEPPARNLLQRYLGLNPPTRFRTGDLETSSTTPARARKFASDAVAYRLAVRIERGEYVAVNPSTAIRAWALPEYYTELLLLHDALTQLHVDHAFVCLTAGSETDLVFQRPWLVTREPGEEVAGKVDRFIYNYRWHGQETIDAFGGSYRLPTLSVPETALLLGATGLSREVMAARDLVEEHPPPESLVPAFNYFGMGLESDRLDSQDPGIRFPAFIQERRAQLSEELLKGGSS